MLVVFLAVILHLLTLKLEVLFVGFDVLFALMLDVFLLSAAVALLHVFLLSAAVAFLHVLLLGTAVAFLHLFLLGAAVTLLLFHRLLHGSGRGLFLLGHLHGLFGFLFLFFDLGIHVLDAHGADGEESQGAQ